MPDHEDSAAPIACRSLDRLPATLHATLDQAGAGDVAEAVVGVTAEAYVLGHRDGARCAVGEIAPAAAERGLHLWLAPELCDDAESAPA